jgi:serine/threonine-protein kinase HipA
MKYESDGGPSAARMLRLLEDHCPSEDRYRFVNYLAYNYLVGGPDSHAKNFSVLLAGDTVQLAPMYDVASVFPYETGPRSELNKLAFTIGSERRFGMLTERNWAILARRTGLDEQRVIAGVHDLARRLPDAMNTVLNRHAAAPGAKELAARMLPRLTQNCMSALGNTPRPSPMSPQTQPLEMITDQAVSFDQVTVAPHTHETADTFTASAPPDLSGSRYELPDPNHEITPSPYTPPLEQSQRNRDTSRER